MQYIFSIFLGLGLSASCGFRVFLPLLITNIASMLGYLKLGAGYEWMGSWPAFVVLITASAIEIAAYYIPWLDNALDTIGIPLAVAAGTMLSSSFISEMDPMLRWVLALIVGGSAAGIIKGGAAAVRLGSSAVTGGLGNWLVTTLENLASVILSVVAVFIPVLASLSALIVIVFSSYKILTRKKRRKPKTAQTS